MTSSSRPNVVVLSSGIRARGRGCTGASPPPGEVARLRPVAQEACLQLLEGHAGLDAELVGEPLARLGVGGDRLLAATAAIEGRDEQGPQPLSGRVLVDQPAHAPDQLPVPALLEGQVAAVFQRPQSPLLQAHGLGLQVRRDPHVGEGIASPEAECLAEEVAREPEVSRHAGVLRLPDEVREPLGVRGHQVRLEAGAVVGALDGTFGQRHSELAEQPVERVGWVGGHGPGPQLDREVVG